MRIYFFLLLLISCLYHHTMAQTGFYPLSWASKSSANERTEATAIPFVDTLRLPFYYDFSSRYIQLNLGSCKCVTSSAGPVTINSLRPHGLKTGDTVNVIGGPPSGLKYVKKISSYQFDVYDDVTLTTQSQSLGLLRYLRISKLGATETYIPDTLAFYYNAGGTQVNGGYGENQPGYHVVSFDGVDQDGLPYNTINTLATGYTDSLRSQLFDFSSYLPSDSLYMSFLYQHGGYGEQPDVNDHLYLEFLDNTSTWNPAFDVTGSNAGSTDSFYIAMVPIKDTKYFYNKFQYRFRTFGRQSGSYDVWNVDNIYLDKGRHATDIQPRDMGIRNGESSFLQKYSAMPFDHFFPLRNSIVKTQMSTVLTNITLVANNKIARFTLTDSQQNVLAALDSSPDFNPWFDSVCTFMMPIPYNYDISVINRPTYLEHTYSFRDSLGIDHPFSAPATFDLMYNNFLTKRTYLYDYYAYDDSEAEIAFGSNLAGTQIAVRFKAEKTDTLTHIDICFTRSKGPDLEGSGIYLYVWDKNISATDTSHYRKQAIAIHLQHYPNGFTRYKLDNPVILSQGSIYHIGYQQNFSLLLTTGYDRDNDASDSTYYNDSGTWLKVGSDPNNPTGSMMIRPVFFNQSNNVPVGNLQPTNDIIKNKLLLYPNPASTSINVVSQEESITDFTYTIYSLYGQTLLNGTLTAEENNINITSLNSGLYLILCTDELHRSYSSRFIKE
ncbi:MAG: hypothetical protein JWO58_3063 [Chitinophagaceae bacterium]|nr:hypothetical protein [Chitinophagaceae bacterium]